MRIFDGRQYRDATEAEVALFAARMAEQAANERSRQLTQEEVTGMLIAAQINTLNVDDTTALRMVNFYPKWTLGSKYSSGYKVQRAGGLWRCKQAHTAQAGWEPETAAALWERVDEQHAGTKYDPIPYDGNMALAEGLYYTQGGVIYLCTRSTESPVYNALSELVGAYVEVVTTT